MMERHRMLRADGNLSYLEFIMLVRQLWLDGHPDIPFVPAFSPEHAQYPNITYQLELRKPHQNETKPRVREEISDEDGNIFLITAQKFQNVVTFTAVDEIQADSTAIVAPLRVEEIIETFENFMIEFTPIYKRLGAAEFIYARRQGDVVDDRRNAPALLKRSISYMLTTEKIIKTAYSKLEKVEIDARVWLRQGFPDPVACATPDITIDLFEQFGGVLEEGQ